MDRAEFLNRLEAQLLDVPQAEREEALQYYILYNIVCVINYKIRFSFCQGQQG